MHRRVAAGGGALLLLALLVSPPIEVLSESFLVVHHLAHWLMVLAGAVVGYQLRAMVKPRVAGVIAWAGLVVAFAWHVPSLLDWAEADARRHMFAHASLLAGGVGMGWAVPSLGSVHRAFMFIGANVVMWPLVLAELTGAFDYARYPNQASAAGVAELLSMSAAWVVIGAWSVVSHRFRPVSAGGPFPSGSPRPAGR